MEIRDILKNLREKNGLTQDQLAERVMVTRQAVSRWETGETQPGTDTLKLLSKEFGVTINTLLGSPTRLVCQCCGMPLDQDDMVSREASTRITASGVIPMAHSHTIPKTACWISLLHTCRIRRMSLIMRDAGNMTVIYLC